LETDEGDAKEVIKGNLRIIPIFFLVFYDFEEDLNLFLDLIGGVTS
jgi:hypothetical protein